MKLYGNDIRSEKRCSMKGFWFAIRNNLLEPKHVKNMGSAVWLLMWLEDHVTSTDEAGTGTVLGGRPVKYDEVAEELGISNDSYTRWIDKLLEYPYIETKVAPYGIIFKVYKSGKSNRKSANRNREIAVRNRQNKEPNKTIQDNNKDNNATGSVAQANSKSFFSRVRQDGSVPMELPEFVLMCRASAQRNIRIIGEYADERKLNYTTRAQWRELGLRNMRAAKRLAPFTDGRIANAVKKIEEQIARKGDFKWGLETIEKYLEIVN